MLLSELMDPAPIRAELPPLLRPRHVGGTAAWQSLTRQGAIAVLDLDAATVSGSPVTPNLRAAALAPHVPTHCFVVGRSAAWVHCGGQPPEKLYLGHQLGTNRPSRWIATEIWSGSGLWAESVLLGVDGERVRVTTPMRTAIDLALREDPEVSLRLIAALAADGLDLVRTARALELRGRTRAIPQARAVFAQLLAVTN